MKLKIKYKNKKVTIIHSNGSSTLVKVAHLIGRVREEKEKKSN